MDSCDVVLVFVDRFHVQYDASTGDRVDNNFKQSDLSSDTDLYHKNSTKSPIKLDVEISLKTLVKTFRPTA